MAIFFIKKEKIWPSVSWCCILTRRIDKPVSVVNIKKCGKFVQKLAEHSVSNIVHIHMADNYGHSAEPITCHLALYESFEIERNDEGRGWIRVSREFVTKLNVEQSSTLMMDGACTSREVGTLQRPTLETIFEDIQY